MYPDLSYLFNDILGTEVDNWVSIFKTFGFILVLALTACGVFLKYELKQKEKAGLILPQKVSISNSEHVSWSDIFTNSLFLLIIGAKLPLLIMNFNSFKGDPASFIFSKQGIWWIGFILALGSFAYHLWKNKNADSTTKTSEMMLYPSDKTNDIIIIAGISGVLGSKLFSITEDMSGFFKDPLGALFSGSGLNIYGGLILASIAVIWYTKKNGIKTSYMMDIGGMGILLGYAIGRIGCQLSGDGDWGIEASLPPNWWFLPDWLWSYNYPTNVNNDGVLMANCNPEVYKASIMQGLSYEESCVQSCGKRYCHELNPKVYPTPIYETVICLIAFFAMWLNKNKFKIPGSIFFTYMIFNGVERFFIERIRVNEKYEMLGLNWSQAQYISILFILIGILGFVYLFNKNKEEAVS